MEQFVHIECQPILDCVSTKNLINLLGAAPEIHVQCTIYVSTPKKKKKKRWTMNRWWKKTAGRCIGYDSMANNNKFIYLHKSIECDNCSIRAHFIGLTKLNLIPQMSSLYIPTVACPCHCTSMSVWVNKQNSNIINVLIVRKHEIIVEMDSIRKQTHV